MDGIILTPLKKIHHPKGDLFHAMKASDAGYEGFGEAYFSNVSYDEIKGWKQHTEMTLNLIVVIGEIKFVIYDGRTFFDVILSINNYQRLSVAPGLWVAFKGLSASNMLLNLANIAHMPSESNNMALNGFDYDWSKEQKKCG